jgi:D-alanyl-D-alanine-carboxypeptidase/D-alanyl-D-alanine-endopeptidase
MKHTFCVFAFLFFISPFIAVSQTGNDSLSMLIDKLGNDLIKEKEAVGLSIGVFDNGKTSFYNFGSTQKGETVAPTQHTVYEIGSITKTFVSYLLAIAVLEHKVNLEDDIRKHLKESYPDLEYDGHPIKLMHLANTTSLLPDWLPELPAEMKGLSSDSALNIKIGYYKELNKHDLFRALHQFKPDTIPGTRRYHSNAAAQLLAYILEDVYKTPMDKLISKHITRPYKLVGTSFIHPGTKGLATGYTATGKESIYEYAMPYFRYAGGMGSTTNDLVKYIGLLLDRDNPASLLALKKTAEISATSGKVVAMRPDSIASPETYSTALNWFKYQPSVNYAQIWSDGGTNGFNSYVVIYPYSNSGVVILTNRSSEKIFRSLPGIASRISKEMGKK